MSQPTDFDAFLSDWLVDDGPSDVPARVAAGAIAEVRALSPVHAGPRGLVRPLPRSVRPARLLALAAALALLGAAVAIAFALLRPSPTPTPPSVVLPANGLIVASEDGDIILVDPTTAAKQVLSDTLGDDTATSISPDGRTIAWWSQDDIAHTWSLFLRDVGPEADGSMASFPVEQPGAVAWAPGSDLIAVTHPVGGRGRLTIIDRHGGAFEEFADLDVQQATWRPDGRALAVWTRDGATPELALVPSTGGEPVRIARGEPADPSTAEALQLWSASWSPDGRWIAYVSNVDAAGGPDGSPASRVFVMKADGSDPRMLELPADRSTQAIVRWSADSSRLLARVTGEETTRFALLPVDGSPATVAAELDGVGGWHVAWSPDETKLVAARQHEPAFIVDLASGERTPQSWMTAYGMAWQPIPAP